MLESLAFYLPQFHRFAQNDAWWGEGFTEWTQLRPAKPFFSWQRIRRPVPPLGYYDIMEEPGVIEAQARLASQYGVDGFAIWDYWLGEGRRLLDQPIQRILNERLKVRYCIAWANHSWYDLSVHKLLMEQKYLGADDYAAYFRQCEPHLHNDHYVRIDGKPVFVIFKPREIPDLPVFIDTWRALAERSGLPGLHLIGENLSPADPLTALFDAHADSAAFWTTAKNLPWNYLREKARTRLGVRFRTPDAYDYWAMVKDAIPAGAGDRFAPTVNTGWDTTPRHGLRGKVFRNFDMRAFRRHLDSVADFLIARGASRNLVFVKSWNEWAEGNILEPDDQFGSRPAEEYRRFVDRVRSGLAA